MIKTGISLLLMHIIFIMSCGSPEGTKKLTQGLPLSSHEHKLNLNADKFIDMENGFKNYWDIVKTVAEEQGLKIVESEKGFKLKQKQVVFYDTKNLDLYKNNFLIRKKTKVKDGKPDSKFDLTLKFKINNDEQVSLAKLEVGTEYKATAEEMEVEMDLINSAKPDGNHKEVYTAQISVLLEANPGNTLADYSKVFPILKSLKLDSSLILLPVNNIETEEIKVSPGVIYFDQQLLAECDLSVWIVNGEIIPEFSFDYPATELEKLPQKSIDQSESFITKLQLKASEWYVEGRSKTSYVFNR